MAASQIAIAIFQLIFYLGVAAAVGLVIRRHGAREPGNWMPLNISLMFFVALRVIGSLLELISYAPGKGSLAKQSAVLDSVGLSPLLLALIGVLRRANDNMQNGFRFWVYIPIQVIGVAATVAFGVGGRQAFGKSGSVDSSYTAMMHAGVIVFLSIFVAIEALAFVTYRRLVKQSIGTSHRTEKAAMQSLFVIIPFVTDRLVFSLATVFTTDHSSVFFPLSTASGSIWVHFAMATIMEMAVVVVIMTVPFVYASRSEIVAQRHASYRLDSELDLRFTGVSMR